MQEQVLRTVAIADYVQRHFHSDCVRVQETAKTITLSAPSEQHTEKTWEAFFAGPDCPDFTIDRNNEPTQSKDLF